MRPRSPALLPLPDPATRRAIAAEAGVSRCTVENYYEGLPMRSTTLARFERVLQGRGLPRRAPAVVDVVARVPRAPRPARVVWPDPRPWPPDAPAAPGETTDGGEDLEGPEGPR